MAAPSVQPRPRPRRGPAPRTPATSRRALAGERQAQRALYDRWRPPVFRVARAFAELDPDEVDDVVQESFIRAFRRLSSLTEPARFGPWILTIARNRALTRLARRHASLDLSNRLAQEAEAQGGEEGNLPEPDREAELALVRELIANLPAGPEKETVHLFYVEGGLSAREIAARLGVGKSAITMRLERFRAKVKRRLAAEVARLRGEGSSD